MQRTGLWVSHGGHLDIRQLPPISPSMLKPDEYLIRVIYSGINPSDQKHSLYHAINDIITGHDFTGTVIARGSGSLPLIPGTLVCGLSRAGLFEGNLGSGLYGAHQQFLVASEKGLFSLPANTSEAELQVLATMPVIAVTAADCVFGLMKFDTTPSKKNKVPLLVWGGGSAVGHAVVQFARDAGVGPILVLASPSHHEVLLRHGATRCFDYRQIDTARHQIAGAMKELFPDGDGYIRHAIDASGMNSADIESIISDGSETNINFRLVTTVGSFEHVLKAFAAVIFEEDVHLGGGKVVRGRAADGALARDKVQWAIGQLGSQFHQVPVKLIDGGWPDLIDGITRVAAGRVSFCKLVFKMPQEEEADGAREGTGTA